MVIGVFFTGMLYHYVVRGAPPLQPIAMLGGAGWAVGNAACPFIIEVRTSNPLTPFARQRGVSLLLTITLVCSCLCVRHTDDRHGPRALDMGLDQHVHRLVLWALRYVSSQLIRLCGHATRTEQNLERSREKEQE